MYLWLFLQIYPCYLWWLVCGPCHICLFFKKLHSALAHILKAYSDQRAITYIWLQMTCNMLCKSICINYSYSIDILICAECESAFTGYGEQELSGVGGFEEQQVSGERNRLSKHTSIQLQQHRNPGLHRANSLIATAVHRDLQHTHLTRIVFMIRLHLQVCEIGTD